MIWPFKRSRNGVKVSEGPTTEEVEAEEVEAEARKVRRDAAQKRIVDSMREAQVARQATISMEADHVKATDDRHRKAETTIRQAQEKATEVSGIFGPPPGKTAAEAASDALEAEEAG